MPIRGNLSRKILRRAIRKDFGRSVPGKKSKKAYAREVIFSLAGRASRPASRRAEAHMQTSHNIPIESPQNSACKRVECPVPRPHARQTLLLEEVFRRACEWIGLAYRDPELAPETVAQHLCCSRATLYRAFRSRAWTVANYIQRVRLEHVHAEFAFVSPRIPINSIALGSGFEFLRHFHRQFKRLYGRTPGACRRELYGTSRSPACEPYDPSSGPDAGVCNRASLGSNGAAVGSAAKTSQSV